MLAGTISAKDTKAVPSEYNYEVHFEDGTLEDGSVIQYSYSKVFDYITEKYEDDVRKVNQIVIDLIK